MIESRRPGAAPWWGLLLVLVGLVFLVQTLQVLPWPSDVTAGAVMVAIGAVLLGAFAARGLGWWAAVAGAATAGLGTGLVIDTVWPGTGPAWAGTLLLGAAGLGFLAVYARRPQRWWPLVPAGSLLTIAVVAGGSEALAPGVSGAVFLWGVAVTFAAVALAPAPGARAWAWIVAAVLGVLGLAAIAPTGASAAVWPALLVLAGLLLLVRELRRPRAG